MSTRLTRSAALPLLVAIYTVAALACAAAAHSAPSHNPLHHRGSHRRAHLIRPARGKGYASTSSCAGTAPRVCFTGDPFYRYSGQCTWYAAGRRPDLDGIVWGNAGNWLREAHGKLPEGTAPQVGAIAVWLPWTGGAWGAGHVAYVAAVSGGQVTVEDFNWGSEQWHRHTVAASAISGYIYMRSGSSPVPAPVSAPAPTPAPAPVSSPAPTPGTSAPDPPSGGQPTPPPPAAGPTVYVHHVTGTCRDGHCGLTLRSGPGYSSHAALGALPEGAEADVTCQSEGEVVSNGYYSSGIWDRLAGGAWVSDFYLDTPNIGTWSPPIPQC